ncbi:hypothetical protein PMZ80_005336 [Knufia obscura]|uniref:Uncharacterized protein n=2 Tax=Knufia TaxID=430999 RepID=A0AAN8EKP6_9EURO|nr:hypothetical protein PMZ80_005336 [Knufia obscura]KAK5958004.1 hypothetical protein OHC33_001194 [Knufia fluminis]
MTSSEFGKLNLNNGFPTLGTNASAAMPSPSSPTKIGFNGESVCVTCKSAINIREGELCESCNGLFHAKCWDFGFGAALQREKDPTRKMTCRNCRSSLDKLSTEHLKPVEGNVFGEGQQEVHAFGRATGLGSFGVATPRAQTRQPAQTREEKEQLPQPMPANGDLRRSTRQPVTNQADLNIDRGLIHSDHWCKLQYDPTFHFDTDYAENEEPIEPHFAIGDTVKILGLSKDSPDCGRQFKIVDRRYEEGDKDSDSDDDGDDSSRREGAADCEMADEDGVDEIRGGWYYRLNAVPGKKDRGMAALSFWHESQVELDIGGADEDEDEIILDDDQRRSLRQALGAEGDREGFIESAGLLFVD